MSMSAVHGWGVDIANALMKALPLSTGTRRRFNRKTVRPPCTDDQRLVRFCSLCRMTLPVAQVVRLLAPEFSRVRPRLLLRVATVRGSVTFRIFRQSGGSVRRSPRPSIQNGKGVYGIETDTARPKRTLLACTFAKRAGYVQRRNQRFRQSIRSVICSRVWQAAMSALKRRASAG